MLIRGGEDQQSCRRGTSTGHLSLSIIHFSLASLVPEITCLPENSFSPIPNIHWQQSGGKEFTSAFLLVVTYDPHILISKRQFLHRKSRLLSLLESSCALTEGPKTSFYYNWFPVAMVPKQTTQTLYSNASTSFHLGARGHSLNQL